MSAIQELFSEYAGMRDNGLDSKAALRALRPYIETLGQDDKQELANLLRAWEAGDIQSPAMQRTPPPAPAPNQSSVIKPLKSLTGSGNTVEESGTWVSCVNCGKKNREVDVFCYGCGHILQPGAGEHSTKHFANATDDLFSSEYFGPDSVLVLELRDEGQFFELRPQQRAHEVVIGRSTGNSAMIPDVDLAPFRGEELGVSRLHLSVNYIPNDNLIQVYDLGSANGTHINGQRLHPKERRVLRHNDEVRLGRYILRVYYNHPGHELH